jgi:peptidoglycan/LPS O-acetylase OafA/YrhL
LPLAKTTVPLPANPSQELGATAPDAHAITGYQPEVDGLRAVAVLSVLGFHAFPEWLPGGFVGVDVFFVISGYLISGILVADLSRGRFSLAHFYARRIRRIFPPLLLVLAASMGFGWLVLYPIEYESLGKHVAGSAAFVSNFVLWSEAGYFDAAAHTKPLLHLWSLGIEEQFYAVWPFVLFLAWRARLNVLLAVLGIGAISFGINIATIRHASADFYSPLTRFWELLAGGALASFSLSAPGWHQSLTLALRNGPRLVKMMVFELVGVAGLASIAASVWAFDKDTSFPGWAALLPVAGACLIIVARDAWTIRWLLANRLAVGIGLISYPLYLWHWPLLSFLWIIDGAAPTPLEAWVALGVSAVLACASYRLVETPIRFGPRRQRVLAGLAGAMLAVGIMGVYIDRNQGVAFRQRSGVQEVTDTMRDFEQSPENSQYHGLPAWVAGNPDAPETVFFGDSTMLQYYPRIERLARHTVDLDSNRLVLLIRRGCLTIPDISNPPCGDFAKTAIPLLYMPSVRRVIIAELWTSHFNVEFFLNRYGKDMPINLSPVARETAFNNLATLIRELTNAGKSVVVLRETPVYPAFEPSRMLPTGWGRLSGEMYIPPPPARAAMENYNRAVGDRIEKDALAAGASVINPMDYLCGRETCPLLTPDGHLIYYNYDHLRASFVRDHVTYLDGLFR